MNAKYYPALREYAEYAQKVITADPSISKQAANKPSDLLVNVNNTLADTFGVDDKDFALEVAKQIFYGYYIEVNSHYRKENKK